MLQRVKAPDISNADSELSRRLFSGAVTPIVKYSGYGGNRYDHQIAIDLGNLAGEKAWKQNPIVITLALVICSGLTSWLLAFVHTGWYVAIYAIEALRH